MIYIHVSILGTIYNFTQWNERLSWQQIRFNSWHSLHIKHFASNQNHIRLYAINLFEKFLRIILLAQRNK